jgi:heme/copper-type cytochrome/quinol oxidase subunit 4
MIGDSTAWPFGRRSALLAIAVDGSIVGVVTLLHASIQLGWDIPLTIAEGLIGERAEHGGAGTYILGVFLHFFIAFTATAVYYAASRRLTFLKEHPLVCGLYYGATVQLVMHLIVFPLCAFHESNPVPIRELLLGMLYKMVEAGLPISYSIRRFSKQT